MLSTVEMLSSPPNSVRVRCRRRLSSLPLATWRLSRHFSIGVIEKNGNGFHSSRHLMGQRRLAGDLALGLALIGISLMIIAHECANLNFKIFEKTAKIGLIISTFALLLATLNFHWIDIKADKLKYVLNLIFLDVYVSE
uniref:Uncharacterized protein n=1 Tax=Meloidogyne enterolobii TaxID=390850 RepID=A0A6V7WKI0_MELEN|nr:unnamed protein product [Meloidogyne enterolobii]